MIEPQTVFENVKLLLNFPEEDNEKVMGLCNASANTLSRRLKETCTGEETEAIYACAAFTAYRYALLKSCLDDYCDYLKTGDITVRRSVSSLVEASEKLLADAFSSAECFTDIGFVFKGFQCERKE